MGITVDPTSEDQTRIHVVERIAVVGSPGSGKSTVAKALSSRLGIPHLELDSVFHQPGWQALPTDEFQGVVRTFTGRPAWVVDGNYRHVRDLVWPRATAAIWLNYPFLTIFRRIFWRTVRRAVRGVELYAGNRESLRKSFFSRESILWWMISTYARRRREFNALRAENLFPQLTWLEFRRPRQAEEFLDHLAHPKRYFCERCD